ncbi:FKBP-type peptidyl-prolyl cis-trans isomerase [Ekhidna lutea]|uniref:Peptidyl-prolyl cis-trans isomerase n=1 Tax=Ekhidna lutea TaxID=447679 RepID=A0A239IM96_EKHLU|nr:FKBP-type peptidyl-prolyl cis-trans isomerase [Ekhidna lutea]SNS94512.1 FKBP-type peptidyl-prolyl cis-trans isomerase [Ekhidna lutea]
MKNLGFLILAISMAACGTSTFETEGGTTVTYLEKGDGNLPVDSLVSMFKIKYTTEDGKVMMDTDEPMPLKVDPNNEVNQGELFEVLTQLRTGDSVGFELVASELFTNTFRAPLPDSIPENSKIKFQIAYIDQLTEQGYFDMVAEKAEKAAEKQMVIDNELLDNYLEEQGVENVETTESGLRYVITEEGNGSQPEAGQTVKVNYAGYLMDGTYFDTSIESVAKDQGIFRPGRQYQPLSFPIGQGRVIKGWDEGIGLLNEGAKATLYVPSPLGYGNRGSAPVIKPNSILVFDVELVEIEE